MKTLNFPHCCTAKIVADFGQSEFAEGGERVIQKKALYDNLTRSIQSHKYTGMAMLVATTNNEQTTANEVLEELDFLHSAWMKKTEHPQTKVRLWYKVLN